jgi:hypothetical protein
MQRSSLIADVTRQQEELAMHSVRRHFRCISILLLAASLECHAGSAEESATSWFMTNYVPLWESLDKTSPEAITDFWVGAFRDHPVDEDSSIWDNSIERWQRNIDRHRADGLTGSTVVQLEVEEINERAVIIRAKWMDQGTKSQNDDPYYCGTYIAGTFQGEWKFTNYFTVECKRP